MKYGVRQYSVLVLQNRLKWLGYPITDKPGYYQRSTERAITRFQSKFFLNTSGVVTRSTWTKVVSVSGRVNALPSACRTRTSLCIDKRAKVLRYVRNGTVLTTLDARFGTSSTPTPNGTFRVYRKSRDHYSSLYGSWMPYAMFFRGGVAVHYSPYFAADGYYGGSHGCVNIRDKAGVARLYDRVPIGTRVVVYGR